MQKASQLFDHRLYLSAVCLQYDKNSETSYFNIEMSAGGQNRTQEVCQGADKTVYP
jgi:hypothetical protein